MQPLRLVTICQSFFFLLFSLLLMQGTQAQSTCATDEIHRQMLGSNPGYKKAVELQNAQWQRYRKEASTKSNRPAVAEDDLLEIPVVIHVVHSGEPIGSFTNPSDSTLIAVIRNLNAIFAANFHEGINTDGSAEIPIRFKLARRTPDCQPTNGINRVDGSGVPGYREYGILIGGDLGAEQDAIRGLSSWPNTAYLNIWMVTHFQGTTAAGFGTFPGTMNGIDGITMVGSSIVLLVHEIGHYLSLHHTFLETGGGGPCPLNNDCTSDGDQVCDTEPHYMLGCNTGINPCTGQPWGPVVRNFMNYNNYSCQGMFTEGQKDKMLYALEHLRTSLTTSLGGLPPGSEAPPVALPSPACALVDSGGNYGFLYGPTNIQVADLHVINGDYSTDGNLFYVDHTKISCVQPQSVAHLVPGETYTITVNTEIYRQNVRGWIDFNNDGIFQSSELIISSNGTTEFQTHTASFTVPAGVSVCTSLRMRIAAGEISGAVPGPCVDLNWGQVEDFIVIVQDAAIAIPSVTIAANTRDSICEGTNVTFTGTPVNAGTNPTYQWKKNGINVGTNSNTYNSSELISGDIISCIMSGQTPCAVYSTVGSNLVTMTVNPRPSVSISVYPATLTCGGTMATFTATAQNGGIDPKFQWKKNNINVGGTGNVYATHELKSGDVIYCEMTIRETCPASQKVVSNEITMTIADPPAGSVTILSPIAACVPQRIIFDGTDNIGPTTIQLADLNITNGGYFNDNSRFYIDHTIALTPDCIQSQPVAHLYPGEEYTLTVVTADINKENVKGWIDYNNDGIFQSTELILNNKGTTAFETHTATFTVPTGLATCTPLRMRIIADFNFEPHPCADLYYGQAEDFIVILQDRTIPVASLSIATNSSGAICPGDNVNFIATHVNGGPYPTYQWKLNDNNVGTNSSTYSNSTLSNGDIVTCVLTSSNPCVAIPTATSNSITMSFATGGAMPSVDIAASVSGTICTGTSVTFTATATNGGTLPKYQWKVGNILVGGNTPMYTTTNLTNGSVVTCTITSNSSCAATPTAVSKAITVSVGSPPLTTIVATGPTTFCAGKSVLLKAPVAAGYTYQWRKAGVNIDNATGATYTATLAGSYSALVSNNGGCPAISQTINVTINPVPLATVAAASALIFCEGKTVQLKAITGAGYTYQWKRGGADIAGATSSNYTASTTGFYTVIVANAIGCSTTSAALAVVVKPLPAATITAVGPTTLCSGKNVLLKANTGTSYTYKWIRGATVISDAIQSSYAATTPGQYTVVVTNASGCSVTSAAIPVSVTPLPAALITPAGPLTFCAGQSVSLKANTGTNYTYQWKKAGVNIPDATLVSYTASVSGVYSVVVTNAAGCSVTSPGVTVTVNSVPLATVVAASATSFCAGKNVLLKAINAAGYKYQWRKNGVSIPHDTTSNHTATATGVYSVVVSNVAGCSTTSIGIDVTVTPAPLATVAIAGPLTFCEGKNVLLKAIAAPGYIYQWKKNGINLSGQTLSNYTATTTGLYTVTVTNAEGCSTVSAGINVTVNPVPVAIITASGPLSFPQGGNVILSVAAAAGNVYQWKKDGVNIVGATSESYAASAGGTYTVVITNVGGCQAVSQPTVISVTQERAITKNFTGEEDLIKVYPNPLYRNDYLNIDRSIAGADKSVLVTIFDMSGRKINSQLLTANVRTVKITGASGMYTVECRWGINKREVFRVIKIE